MDNLINGELLINNDAHKTSRNVEEKEEEVEIEDETAKAGVEVTHGIHDTVTFIDTTAFLRGGHTRDPENLDDRKQTVTRVSTAAGAIPAAKLDRVNSRRSTPIADRAAHVQCQPQFARLVAGGTVREYEGVATCTRQKGYCLDCEDALENTSCSCSSLNSPKRKSSTTSDSSYVCSLASMKTVASLDHSIEVHDLHANNEANATKHILRISSNFDGMNEEFIGAACGNGQISVYDSKQSSFQLNCTRNWENLSSSIDASTSRKKFWSDLKCENSTPQSIEKIWTENEQYTQNIAIYNSQHIISRYKDENRKV
ncbi:hypothetical protein WN51_05607 [Melipona quadrifasciata]|uniref:Uncharacterized protein n=1 Tax=Melipona quadrifasciata TaxID=166423 RepID=A0A0N1IT63_9HYME|nr:hypothetical protein WN51_05607 [Melipona quadrifasciata]